MPLKNLTAMVKEKARNAINPDWLAKAKNLKDIALEARKPQAQYEKHESLKLNKLSGSEEDPAVLIVKCIGDRHEANTERGPVMVSDVEVVFSSDPTVKAGKYSVWENLTVLHSEMDDYAKRYGDNGSIMDKQFMIAYYGQKATKTKGHKPTYIFRVIPYQEDAS